MRFKIAADIAKALSKTGAPVFSVGEHIYSSKEIDTEHHDCVDINGTSVEFTVVLKLSEETLTATDLPEAKSRLVNRLVDWFCHERNPAYFHMQSCNYLGENIFASPPIKIFMKKVGLILMPSPDCPTATP